MNEDHFIDVVALIFVKDDAVLMAQRSFNDRLAGMWEFPGGKIEPNEPPERALIREIQEELGIHITVKDYFYTVEYPDPHVPVRLHAYFGQQIDGVLEAKVHTQIAWFPVSELMSLHLAPADIPIVKALIKQLGEK